MNIQYIRTQNRVKCQIIGQVRSSVMNAWCATAVDMFAVLQFPGGSSSILAGTQILQQADHWAVHPAVFEQKALGHICHDIR